MGLGFRDITFFINAVGLLAARGRNVRVLVFGIGEVKCVYLHAAPKYAIHLPPNLLARPLLMCCPISGTVSPQSPLLRKPCVHLFLPYMGHALCHPTCCHIFNPALFPNTGVLLFRQRALPGLLAHPFIYALLKPTN